MRVSLILLAILASLLSGCLVSPNLWKSNNMIVRPRTITLVEGQDVTIDFGRGIIMKFIWMPDQKIWFGETEVMVKDYAKYDFVDSSISYLEGQPGYEKTWPAMNITARGGKDFCRLLNRRARISNLNGYRFRLPSQEEWQTAARCGEQRVFPWGDDWPPKPMSDGVSPNLCGEDFDGSENNSGDEYKNYVIKNFQDGHAGPCAVKKSGRNEFGIFGMAGNVSEWCCSGNSYILKGGSYSDINPDKFRIDYSEPLIDKPWPFFPLLTDRRSNFGTGFRVVIGK